MIQSQTKKKIKCYEVLYIPFKVKKTGFSGLVRFPFTFFQFCPWNQVKFSAAEDGLFLRLKLNKVFLFYEEFWISLWSLV